MTLGSEELIHAIVWYTSKRGEKLTTLRLVKFLYLADLFYARYAKGKTITGWQWDFVYFGPWCKEANEAINHASRTVIQAKEYPSKYDDKKDYRLFWVDDTDEEPNIVETLPTYMWSKLQWAIQRWADDSSGLLDYVYFETEPMIEANPGARLDFSKSQMPEPPKKIEMKKIPKARLEDAKSFIARLQDKYKKGISAQPALGPTDSAYREFISKLEEEDLQTGLEGIAELDSNSGRKS